MVSQFSPPLKRTSVATLTRNLKLRLSEDLSGDARYNLERIDQLGSTFNINTTNNTVVRASGDIQFRPEDNSVGGSGTGGTVEFGDPSQPLDVAIINGPLKVLASGKYLTISHTNSVSDASLTIDTGDANFTLNLPITNAEVAANAAIAGSKVSPVFGNQLVSTQQGLDIISGAHTTQLRAADSPAAGVVPLKLPPNVGSLNAVLITDGNGNTSWSTSTGSGTVTSIDMTVPNILTISGNPVTTVGTLALGLATQAANLVLAGPSVGPNATPTFRQLSSDELVAGSTNLFYTSTLFNNDLATKTTTNLAEGTNLYHTSLRAQDAVGSIILDTATADLSYVAGTSLSVNVLPAGFINSFSGLSSAANILRVDPTIAAPKSSPVGNDVVLIADSENSNNLKKILLSDILTLAGNGYLDTWTSGTTKPVVHNLNSRNVLVEIYDNTSFETVYADSVVRTDLNTVTLTSNPAPSGDGFTVLIKRIL